jgi:hypothetical protein
MRTDAHHQRAAHTQTVYFLATEAFTRPARAGAESAASVASPAIRATVLAECPLTAALDAAKAATAATASTPCC